MMYITGGQFTDTIDKDVGFLIDKWNEVVKENDTVLYIDLYHDWFSGQREDILKQIKNKNIFTICFGQEKKHLETYADFLYIYGIENSVNDGYYSLPYLSRILSELIYNIF